MSDATKQNDPKAAMIQAMSELIAAQGAIKAILDFKNLPDEAIEDAVVKSHELAFGNKPANIKRAVVHFKAFIELIADSHIDAWRSVVDRSKNIGINVASTDKAKASFETSQEG